MLILGLVVGSHDLKYKMSVRSFIETNFSFDDTKPSLGNHFLFIISLTTTVPLLAKCC